MGLEMEAPDYQVGAHFEALDEGVLAAALKSTGYSFSPFQFLLKCGANNLIIAGIVHVEIESYQSTHIFLMCFFKFFKSYPAHPPASSIFNICIVDAFSFCC